MELINAIYIGAFIIIGLLACIGLAWTVALKNMYEDSLEYFDEDEL